MCTKRILIFALLFSLSSCAKDDFFVEDSFIHRQPLNSIQQESQTQLSELAALKSQFGHDLEALISLQIGALKLARDGERITIPQSPTELDLAAIFSLLATEGSINQDEMNQFAASINADIEVLSSHLPQSELKTLIATHALIAISSTALAEASFLPCYDDYEANTLGLAIGYAGCLIFSGGIPGAAICTMAFAAGVVVVEEQFQNCLRNTYPNGSSGN